MSAFVTDQFRILNADSFVESISNNSYYAFLGLSNPTTPSPGFGRTSNWNSSTTNNSTQVFSDGEKKEDSRLQIWRHQKSKEISRLSNTNTAK